MVRLALASTALLAIASSVTAITCPPAGFDAKSEVNLSKYFSGRWYGVAQVPVKFQEADLFNCITANYEIEGETVRVFNTANRGGVKGELVTTNLVASNPDPKVPSKAVVGFPGLPFTNGLYWIVEAGTFDDLLADKKSFEGDNYEWALVSAGKPEIATANGCVTGSGVNNTKGFWLLSRKSNVSAEEREKLLSFVSSKGFDVSALKIIEQEGCTYL